MLILNIESCEDLALQLAAELGLERLSFTSRRFLNGELHLVLESEVSGEDCLVLGSISPPDTQLTLTSLLCHTLKKEGARDIIFATPYFAYARQDKARKGESLTLDWVGKLLKVSGISSIVTIDIHSSRAVELIPVPIDSLSPAQLFASILVKQDLNNTTIVAPDKGAAPRCQAVIEALNQSVALAVFEKTRTPAGVTSVLQQNVNKHAVVIDDILDTGGTLVSCCKTLHERGTEEIIIMITHGLFTGTDWQKLWELGVNHIYCTSSEVTKKQIVDPRITYLSISELFQSHLQSYLVASEAIKSEID